MKIKKSAVFNWNEADTDIPFHLMRNLSFLKKLFVDRSEGDCILWVGFYDLDKVPPHIFTEWEIQEEVNEVSSNYEGQLFKVYFQNYNYLLTELLGFKPGLHFTDEEQLVFIEE
jgi:hypothetical protein